MKIHFLCFSVICIAMVEGIHYLKMVENHQSVYMLGLSSRCYSVMGFPHPNRNRSTIS